MRYYNDNAPSFSTISGKNQSVYFIVHLIFRIFAVQTQVKT